MKIFNPELENHLSPCRRNLFAFTALLIIILSVYSNTFDASWHFDDFGNILNRKSIRMESVSWPAIKKTFFQDDSEMFQSAGKHSLYRPVVCFSLALNYYFGRYHVFGYHLVNISIHIIASFFLFLFIFHTLNLPSLRAEYGSDAYFIALLSAVLWAINPVQTQAITYVVQRMASMAAMFYIMAMYFYVKARMSDRFGHKITLFFLCTLCGTLAIGSKENAAMLPFSLFVFDLFVIQGLKKENLKKNLLVFFAVIAFLMFIAFVFKGASIFSLERLAHGFSKSRPFTMLERLLTEPWIILYYLSLLFYPMPQRLSITHDIVISRGLFDPPGTIIAICTILLILALCIIKARQRPLICFCIIFFFLNHLVEGSVFNLELIFEHRNYLPSMLLFVPVAIIILKGIKFYSHKPVMQAIIIVFMVLVLVGFGHSTFRRNFDWRTEGTLWADAVNKAPGVARPHINLGTYYASHDMLKKALSEFQGAAACKVLNNRTNHPLSLYNIGYIYQRMGDFDQALMFYRTSAKQYPSYADNYNNMGVIYVKKGLKKEAETAFRNTLQFSPGNLTAHRNLALLLLKQGRIDEAMTYLESGLRIKPDDAAMLGSLGYANRLTGSFGEAFRLYRKAIRIEPHDPKLHLYLAEIFYKRGMEQEARSSIQEFAKRGQDPDLRGYILGTTPGEDKLPWVKEYKTKVVKNLGGVYAGRAAHLRSDEKYIQSWLEESKIRKFR